MVEGLWAAYVRRLMRDSGTPTEAAFLRLHGLSVQQGTFNRWKRGSSVPDKPVDVAQFAQEVGRNVLEAFVAAGMLTVEEALRSLDAESLALLAELEGGAQLPSQPAPARSARRSHGPKRSQ